MVRDLPDKLESQFQSAGRRRSRRMRHFHPMMLEELLFHPSVRESPDAQAAGWLMFISQLREDYPWLYEIGLDLYRALRNNNPAEIASARESFQRTMKSMFRMRASRELFYPDDDDAVMMLHHLPEMLDQFMSRLGTPPGEKVRSKKKE